MSSLFNTCQCIIYSKRSHSFSLVLIIWLHAHCLKRKLVPWFWKEILNDFGHISIRSQSCFIFWVLEGQVPRITPRINCKHTHTHVHMGQDSFWLAQPHLIIAPRPAPNHTLLFSHLNPRLKHLSHVGHQPWEGRKAEEKRGNHVLSRNHVWEQMKKPRRRHGLESGRNSAWCESSGGRHGDTAPL